MAGVETAAPSHSGDSATTNRNARAAKLYELALWLAVRQAPPRQLSHGAKLCWDVIARWEQRGMECWAGLLRMAYEVGVTESQASRYVTELIKKQFIDKRQGRKGKPIYHRLQQPDLEVRAEKIYQELTAKGGEASNG